ncbi:PTS mannose/fructose/sorbose/N-acetylgalactosamine transporter subunit IIC [Enterococcus avium]|uniref:PTS mannose/fructose/sorbose/N-acetylgalactosamine transporter subunit IIC n=1 Tax=Enterococcus avium TaxID=33945 RepID=UPI00159D795C|nr:PTS sugar transporter subunit IIC [Enterococcus avium]NVN75510.1 PTS mannose transporter subunit IIC [Enterococcus avium]
MVVQAFLLAIVMFVTYGGNWLTGQSMIDRPIVVGPLVGLVLGDLESGVIIGASLEAVFMGAINVGGTAAVNPAVGTVFGTAFAILLDGGSEVALTLAIPIGILAGAMETLISIVLSASAEPFDRLAKEGKEKSIVALHFGLWVLKFLVFSIIVFVAVLVGSGPIKTFVDSIPDVVMNGLAVCGGLLPAAGFAILLKMLWEKKIAIFYFLGFALVAYLKLPLVALAIIGTVIAVSGAMRDKEILDLKNTKTAAVAAIEDDEEDFFA